MIRDDDRPCNDDRSFRDFRRVADKEAMQRQALADAAGVVAKRLRMRRFTWCRAENAMYDDKSWRLVARMATAPLHLVESFLLRLDLYASANKPRGSLEGFSIPALAAHWAMPNDDVLARIYAALEHPDIGWIDQDHLVTFWDRNPDTEDTTAADRTHRSKAFKRAMKEIVALKRTGRIDAADEAGMIRELYALREETRRGHFSRGELVRRLDLLLQLSPAQGAHDVSGVTTVSLTPRSDQTSNNGDAVDNRAAAAPGESEGLSKGQARVDENDPQGGDVATAEASQWLATEGARLVVERLRVPPSRAATLIERWLQRTGGSHADLAEIIASAAAPGIGGRLRNAAQFDLTIGQACDRRRQLIEQGAQLAMGPGGRAATTTDAAPASDAAPVLELQQQRKAG